MSFFSTVHSGITSFFKGEVRGLSHTSNQVVFHNGNSIRIIIPERPLLSGSLRLEPKGNVLNQTEWEDQNRSELFALINRVINIWNTKGIADYLIYAKESKGANCKFGYEVVPYPKSAWRIWTQFKVLWHITFGGMNLNRAQRSKIANSYKDANGEFLNAQTLQAEKINVVAQSKDAFCDSKVIDKQLVFEGKKINVLYNYAPIVLGKDKLHFMLVPKEHRTKFSDLTEEEYLEAHRLSQKLIKHYGAQGMHTAYIFDKNGAAAGQSVPHWHEHVVFTATKTQELLGKLKVFKNMFFGSSPLPQNELKDRVNNLKIALKPVLT